MRLGAYCVRRRGVSPLDPTHGGHPATPDGVEHHAGLLPGLHFGEIDAEPIGTHVTLAAGRSSLEIRREVVQPEEVPDLHRGQGREECRLEPRAAGDTVRLVGAYDNLESQREALDTLRAGPEEPQSPEVPERREARGLALEGVSGGVEVEGADLAEVYRPVREEWGREILAGSMYGQFHVRVASVSGGSPPATDVEFTLGQPVDRNITEVVGVTEAGVGSEVVAVLRVNQRTDAKQCGGGELEA